MSEPLLQNTFPNTSSVNEVIYDGASVSTTSTISVNTTADSIASNTAEAVNDQMKVHAIGKMLRARLTGKLFPSLLSPGRFLFGDDGRNIDVAALGNDVNAINKVRSASAANDPAIKIAA